MVQIIHRYVTPFNIQVMVKPQIGYGPVHVCILTFGVLLSYPLRCAPGPMGKDRRGGMRYRSSLQGVRSTTCALVDGILGNDGKRKKG